MKIRSLWLPLAVALCSHAKLTSLHAVNLTSVGNVYQVGQMTGSSAPTDTEARWALSGTDIGTMFNDFSGHTWVAFGDSFAYSTVLGGGGSDWRNNLLARAYDFRPSNGLDLLDMISDTQNHSKTIIPKGTGDYTMIPNGGIAIGDKLYIHYQRILQWGNPGHWTANGSGFAVSSDYGQTWTKTSMWAGNSGFVQAAVVRTGGYIYLYGVPAGRFGGVKLARVPEASILNLSAYRYWTGSAWSTSQSAAATIVPPAVGELSVAYNNFLGQYIMLYLNENAFSIQIRTAPALTGPWSAPLNINTSIPQGYGPMLHPTFCTGQDIYFALSSWNPYNVYLMRATLNPTSVSYGPFDLPGRVEAENFREGGQGEAYYDSTAGNFGNVFRNENVDLIWNDNEDAHTVGWTANGEWLSYRVNVLQSGAYKFRLKYANGGAGGSIQVDAPGGNPIYVPATWLGGTGSYAEFRVWEPNNVFNLTAGQQFINLYFPIGGCDITWWEIYPAYSGSTYRLNCGGGAFTDPTGKAWAADGYFSGGGTGSAAVAIANTLDDALYSSERFGVCSYAFPVANGVYKVRLKFAEYVFNNPGQRRFNVDIEGGRKLFDYDIIARAGGKNVAKDELFDVRVEDGTLNINFVSGLADQPKISAIEIVPGDPNLYTNQRVPGHIEAENFRTGGPGVAYHDLTENNIGGAHRGGGVDIRQKPVGGHAVGWIDSGEWLSFSINVAAAGNYKFRLRYSSGASGATVQVDAGPGIVFIPATAVPGTGGWDTFTTWTPASTFFLNPGPQIVNLYFPGGGCDVDYFEIYQ